MPGRDPSKPILRSLAKDGGGNVLHSEKGEVLCRCPATGTERPMAFQGFEKDRGTLKYRCPAAACGLECAGRERCLRDAGAEAGGHGRVVPIALKHQNRRIFTPTPWGGPSWRRGYNRRGALERINARVDGGFGFENHFIRGKAKMKARMGLALCVMTALAPGAVMAGRPERMRSLVDPGLPLAAQTAAPPSAAIDRPGRGATSRAAPTNASSSYLDAPTALETARGRSAPPSGGMATARNRKARRRKRMRSRQKPLQRKCLDRAEGRMEGRRMGQSWPDVPKELLLRCKPRHSMSSSSGKPRGKTRQPGKRWTGKKTSKLA